MLIRKFKTLVWFFLVSQSANNDKGKKQKNTNNALASRMIV